jgi:uncharacterized membrane protein YphA (DoxX/SURF4 family)
MDPRVGPVLQARAVASAQPGSSLGKCSDSVNVAAIADLTLAARLVVAAVFAIAGIAKLIDRDGARQAVRAFGLPRPLVTTVAALLPVGELAVAVAMARRASAVVGAIAALFLLGAFMTAIAISLSHGRQPDCRCFGQVHSAPVTAKTLVRNAVVAALAGLVVVAGPGASLSAWASGLTVTDWITLGVAVALAVAFAMEGSLLVERWKRR